MLRVIISTQIKYTKLLLWHLERHILSHHDACPPQDNIKLTIRSFGFPLLVH